MTRNNSVTSLPDFRNFGVMLRIIVLAEGANLATVFARGAGGVVDLVQMGGGGMLFELTLLIVVFVLFLVARWLQRLTYRNGVWVVILLAGGVAGTVHAGMEWALVGLSAVEPLRAFIVAALLAAPILAYFDWRQRMLSPALADARITALQARIRPHFLFNSLNTAISVVRQDARLAEQVLLDMSDLFRVVLSEPRSLVPLVDEIRVARSYLDIEHLRLGERLKVEWDVGHVPNNALVPVLLLQPLVENAVWHGVEPLEQGGTVTVRVTEKGKMLQIEVTNPVAVQTHSKPGGHRLALNNIRERLALHFDEEARLTTSEEEGIFRVQVEMPVRVSAK